MSTFVSSTLGIVIVSILYYISKPIIVRLTSLQAIIVVTGVIIFLQCIALALLAPFLFEITLYLALVLTFITGLLSVSLHSTNISKLFYILLGVTMVVGIVYLTIG